MVTHGILDRNQARRKPGQPTLGLLIGMLDDHYQNRVWSGIVDAAEEAGVNLHRLGQQIIPR